MYTIDTRVRYSEINSEKQLTLSALLDYLQDCCTFQSEDLGIGLDYLEQEKVAWILLSWQIEVLRYPEMGEEIQISTWPYDFKGFYGKRNFLVTNKKGEVLAKVDSLWVFMDVIRMRPARIIEKMVEVFSKEISEPLSGDWGERKISVPQGGEKKEPVRVARFQIDTNHHMNNGQYVLLAEEFLPEDFVVGGLRTEYKKAAVLGDTLYPVVTVKDNQVFVVLQDEEEQPYAVIQFLRKQQ